MTIETLQTIVASFTLATGNTTQVSLHSTSSCSVQVVPEDSLNILLWQFVREISNDSKQQQQRYSVRLSFECCKLDKLSSLAGPQFILRFPHCQTHWFPIQKHMLIIAAIAHSLSNEINYITITWIYSNRQPIRNQHNDFLLIIVWFLIDSLLNPY